MNMGNIINSQGLWTRLSSYLKSIGRVSSRAVLSLYYVMRSKNTSWKDKTTIFGTLAYLVLPIDVLDAKRIPILGWLDEITSLAVAIQRMSKYITPEIEAKADAVLDRWLPEHVKFVEV